MLLMSTREANIGVDSGHASHEAAIECDPQLAEVALWAAIRGTAFEKAYLAEREACYQELDLELRSRAFSALDQDWFVRLDIAQVALQACSEWPSIMSKVNRCILAPCLRPQEEGAELFGAHERKAGLQEKPNLVIRIQPASLARPSHLQSLLRHELMHINDMLDPHFRYDPSLEQFHDELGIPNAIRERYRILWDMYIDGRIAHSGQLGPEARARRLREFKPLFRVLDIHTLDAFNSIFDADTLDHPTILAYARCPQSFLVKGDL